MNSHAIFQTMASRHAAAVEQQRIQEMQDAWSAYVGLLIEPLVVKKGEPNDNIQVSYARLIVDKGAQFLFGFDPLISTGDEQADSYLNSVWPPEERAVDLLSLAINGGVFGHAWASISIGLDGRPSVVIGDPQCWTAEWSADNYKEVRAYHQSWQGQEGKEFVTVDRTYTRDGNRWTIQEKRDKGWFRTTTVDIPWVFDFPPVYQCQNVLAPNEFYGTSDLHRQVYKHIRAIHRTDSLLCRIVRIHAFPKIIGKGMQPQDLDVRSNGVLFITNPQGGLEMLEISAEGLKAGEVRRDRLREELFLISQIPEVATGRVADIGQLSGLALKILYGPIVERTNLKRLTYGKLVKDLVKGLCAVGNFTVIPQINWPSIVPSDVKEQTEVGLIKTQLGVSETTVLTEMGYSPETEKSLRDIEAADRRDQAAQDRNSGV